MKLVKLVFMTSTKFNVKALLLINIKNYSEMWEISGLIKKSDLFRSGNEIQMWVDQIRSGS